MSNTLKVAVAALGLSATGLVMAQSQPNPWYARVGFNSPTSSNTRNGISKTGFGIGLGYQLNSKGFLSAQNDTPSVELLYSRLNGNGNSTDAFALQYVERIGFGGDHPTGFYVGVGVGLQLTSVRLTTAGGSGGSGGGGGGGGGGGNPDAMFAAAGPLGTNTSVRRLSIAGELMLGYKFTTQFALEASARLSPDVAGVSTNSIAVMANFKF